MDNDIDEFYDVYTPDHLESGESKLESRPSERNIISVPTPTFIPATTHTFVPASAPCNECNHLKMKSITDDLVKAKSKLIENSKAIQLLTRDNTQYHQLYKEQVTVCESYNHKLLAQQGLYENEITLLKKKITDLQKNPLKTLYKKLFNKKSEM
mgnify:FL=1